MIWATLVHYNLSSLILKHIRENIMVISLKKLSEYYSLKEVLYILFG